MAHERLLDREAQPDNAQIKKTIGREVFPVWEAVEEHLAENYPRFKPEIVFYNAREGWAVRYRQEAQQICTLFPERGGFSALITLTPEEEEIVQEKINFFNAKIRELLSRPSSLPQGRWLWIRLEDHTDFVGFKFLMEIKQI